MLTITEELMLLAVHDEKGNVIFAATSSIPYGLSCAILLDLQELGKISIDSETMNIEVINDDSIKIEFLDKAFRQISSKNKNRTLDFWIRALANEIKDYQNLIYENLVLNGILRREAKKLLFLIKFDRYPTLNPAPELETRDNIHKVVMMGIEPHLKLLNLISLMYACNLINEVFPEGMRQIAKKNIKKLTENEKYSKLVIKIAEEMTTLVVSKNSK